MKAFIEHLSTYAEYHRDTRNIATHMVGTHTVGVPVIVPIRWVSRDCPTMGVPVIAQHGAGR